MSKLFRMKNKIYFLDDNNIHDLEEHFKKLYNTSVSKFEERLAIYENELIEVTNYITYDQEKESRIKILINELKETIATLNDKMFKVFFLKLGTETLEKIRYASVSKHSEKCAIRAVFDILFKYIIDFEFKITHLCCDNNAFKILQIDILRDLRWKISTKSFIQSPIQNRIQSLKI